MQNTTSDEEGYALAKLYVGTLDNHILATSLSTEQATI